jgi:hypothetical protein
MDQRTTRRKFLLNSLIATGAAASGTFLAVHVEAEGGGLTLTIPAKQMSDRAKAFKLSFLNNYFVPQAPYPVYRVLYQAGLLPDDLEAERAIGRCGTVIFNGGTATLAVPPIGPLVLPYHVDLTGQHLRNEVTIPPNIKIPIQKSTVSVRSSPLASLRAQV